MIMRTRLALVAVLAAALTATSVGAAAQAAQPSGRGHEVGATAAKKKKKRKKRCRSKRKSPVANALSCRRLVRSLPNQPPTPSGSEIYDFCRNNTYRYRKVNFDFDGRSFTTTYGGRWKAVSSTSGSAGVSGAIQYSVTNFRSAYTDGTPAEAPPPSLLSEAIVFGPFGVDFAGGRYLSGKAPC
jgi:opacity protein-like surface antigen